MKIAIVGASGKVGSHITKEALSRGHQVTAIVRHPEKLAIDNENLIVTKGDLMEVDEIATIIKGHDALVVSYSPGWGPGTEYSLHVKGAKAAIVAAKKAGVNRLINVGGAGSLYLPDGTQLIDSPQFPEGWREGANAQRNSLDVYKQERELDWTFFCPAIMIGPGERTGKFRIGSENPVFDENGESHISYDDYAVALLDELQEPQFIKQRFTVGY